MSPDTSFLNHQQVIRIMSYITFFIIKAVLLLCLGRKKRYFDQSWKHKIYRAKYFKISTMRRRGKKQEKYSYIWVLLPLILRQKYGL